PASGNSRFQSALFHGILRTGQTTPEAPRNSSSLVPRWSEIDRPSHSALVVRIVPACALFCWAGTIRRASSRFHGPHRKPHRRTTVGAHAGRREERFAGMERFG